MDLSIPYYEDMSRISNSNIGWYLKEGPAYLHRHLTGQVPDLETASLRKGTMIHEFILQPEEFDKDYVVYEGIKPSSTNQVSFCKELANSVEIEPQKRLLDAYKKSYSIIGKSEEKMLSEATKIASELTPYIDATNSGKILIGKWDYKLCNDILYAAKEHIAAFSILDRDKDEEIHSEFHINWECEGVQCKSLLDRIKIDKKKKHCTIIDLKTTSHLWQFEDSMKTFDYCRQLCYYYMAVLWYIENELKDNPEDWTFSFFIVAVGNNLPGDVRVFELTLDQVIARKETIVDTLHKIKWHIDNNKWDHSIEYYENNGVEHLDL